MPEAKSSGLAMWGQFSGVVGLAGTCVLSDPALLPTTCPFHLGTTVHRGCSLLRPHLSGQATVVLPALSAGPRGLSLHL